MPLLKPPLASIRRFTLWGLPPGDSCRERADVVVTADYRLRLTKASLLNGGNGRAEQRLKVSVPLTRLHLVHADANGVAG